MDWEKSAEDSKNRAWNRAQQFTQERLERGERSSTMDLYHRNLMSLHKCELHWCFGGKLWWQILIAAGRVTPGIVSVVNDVVKKVIEEDDAPREATTLPSAYTRGHSRRDPDRERKGIQHKMSEAKTLRQKASLLTKIAQKHERRWWDEHNSGRG